MKIKPLLFVLLAMFLAALTFCTTPPCVNGAYMGRYTIRTCEAPDSSDGCSVLQYSQTYDQDCEVWCCPGDKSHPVYNSGTCTNRRKNGCCRNRTDGTWANPQIIYSDSDVHINCATDVSND